MGGDSILPQKPDALAQIEALRAEVELLRRVCGEAYQLAGALGAGEKALDNLSAASAGEPLPHLTFLPVEAPSDTAMLDAVIEGLPQSTSVRLGRSAFVGKYKDSWWSGADGYIKDHESGRDAIRAAMKAEGQR